MAKIEVILKVADLPIVQAVLEDFTTLIAYMEKGSKAHDFAMSMVSRYTGRGIQGEKITI